MSLGATIKKLSYPIEEPPKRKHVRKVILNSHEEKGLITFLDKLHKQKYSIYRNALVCYKSLTAIHFILQEGHYRTIIDTYNRRKIFEMIKSIYLENSEDMYDVLANVYATLLLNKVEFQTKFTEFNGLIDLNNYKAMITNEKFDINVIINRIIGLLDLQDSFLKFENIILSDSKKSYIDCKIAPLVACIIETYNIYLILVLLLQKIIDSDYNIDNNIYDRFNNQYTQLKKFYTTSQTINYITALLSVPKLPENPPIFKNNGNKSFNFDPVSKTSYVSSKPFGLEEKQSFYPLPPAYNPELDLPINMPIYPSYNPELDLPINMPIYPSYNPELDLPINIPIYPIYEQNMTFPQTWTTFESHTSKPILKIYNKRESPSVEQDCYEPLVTLAKNLIFESNENAAERNLRVAVENANLRLQQLVSNVHNIDNNSNK